MLPQQPMLLVTLLLAIRTMFSNEFARYFIFYWRPAETVGVEAGANGLERCGVGRQ